MSWGIKMPDATVSILKVGEDFKVTIYIENEIREFSKKRNDLFGTAISLKDAQFKKALEAVVNEIYINTRPVEVEKEKITEISAEAKPVFVPKKTIEEIIVAVEAKKYKV